MSEVPAAGQTSSLPLSAPLPLVPGPVPGASSLDFVPHFSFADYDAAIGAPPDLIVIPAGPNYTPERDVVILDWIRAHVGPRTTFLAICDGTTILADTGLMDGHAATSNPADLPTSNHTHQPRPCCATSATSMTETSLPRVR